MDKSKILIGRNPVMEALRAGRDIDRLIVGPGNEGSIKKIIAMAKDKHVAIQYQDKSALDRMAEGGNHQGVIAFVSTYVYKEIDDMLKLAESKGEDPFLVILDGLEDPHNLGAIIRSADGAGAHGVIIPKRRSVSVTDVVAKTSAGAIEFMPVARVTNLSRTIDDLKEKGFWIAACDMGEHMYYEADLTGPIAVVIGSEGFGISRLVEEKCDFIVSMPMKGGVNSLNASNAAAILLYEVCRQRDIKAKAQK